MSETSSTIASQRRLGRGLSALLGGGAPAYEETSQGIDSELKHIPTAQLTRNPFQPRKHFDPESLGELAASLKEHGVLQPILVREVEGGYQIIAGERRWQAAQKAGLTSLPCRVVDVIDKTACEYALEENLKRKDLNDLEKAQAFRDYITQFQCTIEELAQQLSMKRSTVNNMLRLLDLPDPVKNALNAGRITAGHARALLPLEQAMQLELSSRIQAEQMSVRQTEATVKKLLGRGEPEQVETPAPAPAPSQPSADPAPQATVAASAAPAAAVAPAAKPAPAPAEQETSETQESATAEHHHEPEQPEAPAETLPLHKEDSNRTNHVSSLEAQLRDMLGVNVEIKLTSKESGQIVVPFSSNHEFERILGTLRRNAA